MIRSFLDASAKVGYDTMDHLSGLDNFGVTQFINKVNLKSKVKLRDFTAIVWRTFIFGLD